jgi:hypothetical protein
VETVFRNYETEDEHAMSQDEFLEVASRKSTIDLIYLYVEILLVDLYLSVSKEFLQRFPSTGL